jgi:D-sedoheptulose 7-phosphate isomerase
MNRVEKILVDCFLDGGKVLICGNGGSAAMSQHIAADFVGRLSSDDDTFLPAVALANPAIVTAIANDFGYHEVFSHQVAVMARPNDVLMVLTTSGESESVVETCMTARDMGIDIVGFWGDGVGVWENLGMIIEYCSDVKLEGTEAIQEYHLREAHRLCRAVKGYVSTYRGDE